MSRPAEAGPRRSRLLSILPVALLAFVAAILLAAQFGLMDGVVAWMHALQRDLHRDLAAAVRAIQAEGAAAGWSLVAISFLYGVFHAAGPGHGKVVIATYLATQPQTLLRGVTLSTLSALTQGLTAILAVEATVLLVGAAARRTQALASDLETASYALVALLGAMLVVRAARRLRRQQAGRHHHDHHHDHGHAGHCGHDHGPTAEDLARPASWLGMAGVVLSVGIRPCSGGILVLVLAHIVGIAWAGMLAVLAMSLGTAITVSALAILAVQARDLAVRLSGALPVGGWLGGAGAARALVDGLALAGGLLILVLGVLLLQSAWRSGAHPLL